jgi:CheY-like chemotaxis protein
LTTVLTSSAGLRVLVVDDLEDMRLLIQRALSARGYAVDVAATLAEARGMDPGGYDAVVLDAHLGRERGTDLVEALRSEDPAAAGRCLVITGGTADTLPDGVAFLAKPFQLDELVDAVRGLHGVDTQGATGDGGIASGPGAHPAAPHPAGAHPAAGHPAAGHPAAAAPGGNHRAGEPQTWQLLRLTRRLRARERHELIDFLHDGPIQELTAVTLDLQMMSRSAPPAPHLDAVIEHLTAAAASLRWLVDGPWQSVQPEIELTYSLQERSAWLLGAPLIVDSEGQAADLGAAEVPVIADVVELMLLGMVTANPPAQAHVAVRADEHLIEIELILIPAAGDNQPIGDPVTAQAALDRLASAFGARGRARLSGRHWRAQIVLPRPPAPVLEPSSLPSG